MDSHPPEAPARRAPSRADGKFLTFSLGDEEYGIAVLCVKEIVGLLPITRVPNLPPQVSGVVNLRGKVVPVVDLRARLGMPHQAPTRRSCIVVVRPSATAMLGLLVDSVLEVRPIPAEEVDRSPGVSAAERGVVGVAKGRGRVQVLLDVVAMLQGDLQGLGA